MHKILTAVKKLLKQSADGKADIADELIDEFGEMCKEAMRKHMKPYNREWRLRLSSLGKQLQEQQCAKLNLPKDTRDEPFLTMKFLIGDMLEAAAVTIMKAANVNINSIQENVTLRVGETDINGTLDIIIDDTVYDIKTASPYSYECKFQGKTYMGAKLPPQAEGFKTLLKSDPFGYVMQGYAYAEAVQKPFGGWIVINKVTGEWHVTEATDQYRGVYLRDAALTVDKLINTTTIDDIDKQIPLAPEKVRNVETGKMVLHPDYNFFSYKGVLGWLDKLTFSKGKYYYEDDNREDTI